MRLCYGCYVSERGFTSKGGRVQNEARFRVQNEARLNSVRVRLTLRCVVIEDKDIEIRDEADRVLVVGCYDNEQQPMSITFA